MVGVRRLSPSAIRQKSIPCLNGQGEIVGDAAISGCWVGVALYQEYCENIVLINRLIYSICSREIKKGRTEGSADPRWIALDRVHLSP